MQFEDSRRSYAKGIDDNGAVVISGINAADFPAQVEAIAAIPQAQRGPAVQSFYLTELWTPSKLGGISDQDLANHVFDGCVNEGRGTSIKALQAAVNQVNRAAALTIDGAIGPDTLDAANECDPSNLLASYTQNRVARYRLIVAANPKDAPYLNVWISRACAD
jgi:lysozyme family protein